MYLLKKLATIPLIVLLAALLAAVYGAVHNQVSCGVSWEYFDPFKFRQFRIPPELHNRLGVALVGVLATWWMGAILGFVSALVGLIHPTWRRMLKVVLLSVVLIIGVAALFGVLGWLHGLLIADDVVAQRSWTGTYAIVEDRRAFVVCGAVHNAGYLGGLAGLIAGIVYQVLARRRGWCHPPAAREAGCG